MKFGLKRVVSILMILIISTQISATTFYNASEIISEVTESQIGSEEITSDEVIEVSSEKSELESIDNLESSEQTLEDPKVKVSTRAFTDFSGIGNQNTSDIGKASYLDPNEQTEDELLTIEQKMASDSRYVSVQDLDADLVDEAIKGVDLHEGIIPYEFDASLSTAEINQIIYDKQEFIGSCWSAEDASDKNHRIIVQAVAQSDNCQYTVEDYATYYNTDTKEFKTVDLHLSIDFLDFFTQQAEYSPSRLRVGTSASGTLFYTTSTEELEYTITYLDKEGNEINVPVIYQFVDVDMGSALAVRDAAIYSLATYYQDPLTSPYGDYPTPYINTSGTYNNGHVFAYEDWYDYVTNAHQNGEVNTLSYYLISGYFPNFDRSYYNSITSISNANGQVTPDERSWNRIKFRESNGYVTIADSWGSNSGFSSTIPAMVTSGKDSEFVIVVNSNETFTANMSNTYFGVDPSVTNRGFTQGYYMSPYRGISSTIIDKSVETSDGSSVKVGDTLTYTIEVTNVSTLVTVYNTIVRDSLLENLPSYLSWDGTVTIDGVVTTLDTDNPQITIDEIKPSETAQIVYNIEVLEIENDVFSIDNVVTNTGEDPKDLCDPNTETPECAATKTPVQPGTIIAKSVNGSSNNQYAKSGETLTYTIDITNPNLQMDAENVPVRDSLLENLPEYLSWDGNFALSPNTIVSSGDLGLGTFVLENVPAASTVTLTYQLVVNEVPVDLANVENIATDNGLDPTDPKSCEDNDDCATAEIPLAADTSIKKSILDENQNGVIEDNETLTYKIEVTNTSSITKAIDVLVRDSLLEEIGKYDYLQFDGNYNVEPTQINYSGDLSLGTFMIAEIEPSETVVISYEITVKTLPKDISEIVNIATDNGDNPTTKEDCELDDLDCAKASLPVAGDTSVKKTTSDSNKNSIIEAGEVIFYTIEVTNYTENDAYNVVVRDSLLESTPEYLTYNNDLKVLDSEVKYSGDITEKDFTLESVKASETVKLTYSMTMSKTLPEDISYVTNIVTDNGSDPSTLDPENCESNLDCAQTTTPINVLVDLEKSVVDENKNGIAEPGETLTYSIVITNTNDQFVAVNSIIRDSLLEDLPVWLTYNDDMYIDPVEIKASGSLVDGYLTIAKLEPEQSITITYSVTVSDEVPSDISSVINIVSSNGKDPKDPESCKVPTTCSSTEIPLEGDTVIEKELSDETGDSNITQGEEITYKITITNKTKNVAHDVVVRDSMLENLPSYLTFNDNVEVSPAVEISGGFLTKDLTLEKVEPGQVIEITYSLTVSGAIPKDVKEIVNIATDNGDNPTKISTCAADNKDCAEAIGLIKAKATSLSETGNTLLILIMCLIASLTLALALKKVIK